MTHLTVANYRGLRDVAIPLSPFVCLVGPNNSGKSSFLQAISLFFSGSKLQPSDFFDESEPVRIEVTFEDVGEGDLGRLAQPHRDKIKEIVEAGRLVLVRSYGLDGKNSLQYSTRVPNEERFSSDAVNALLSRGRPGPALVVKVTAAFPELESVVDREMGQDDMRQKIKELGGSWPEDRMCMVDLPLPTGIDKSISAMLPEPIYVPAVKDLKDDVKTSESATFGKILAILLRAVEGSLPDVHELFQALNTELNRTELEDGTVSDERLDEIKLIESTMEGYVRESFGDVDLRIQIPPPTLKTIFSSAQIFANDGVDGLIDTKGDGLRRTIVFSILRSYVELRSRLDSRTSDESDGSDEAAREQDESATSRPPYVLLFEEPELFLHPTGQNALFAALRVFAADHHVVVTTHSPTFLGSGATETFVKLSKLSRPEISNKPFTLARHVDLSDISAKDQFQIICFENNNSAFFADTVVLVEGDSDFLVFPYLAKILNPAWDSANLPLHFARITGKGNIRRYRDFFQRFDVRVPVIADLDLLLGGFELIAPSQDMVDARTMLLSRVDSLITIREDAAEVSGDEARSAQNSGDLKRLWRTVKERSTAYEDDAGSMDELSSAVDAFFAWQRKNERLAVLRTSGDADMSAVKWRLLQMLRESDVYVLERGAIEEYYPATIVGPDKPSRAMDFCSRIGSREDALACCGEQEVVVDGQRSVRNEFELIFESIFERR